MTEFEIASLALREAALWATIAIGAGQIGIVWYAIRAMNRANDERAKDRRERERADVQRHAEAMTALRELIARTAPAAD